jgi:outer membrane protein TolC
LEKVVSLALQRSPVIVKNRAEVAEQARRLRQLKWEYGPNIGAMAGWKDSLNAAGMEIHGDSGAYKVSAFTESHSDLIDRRFGDGFPLLGQDEEGVFAQVSIGLPLFQGLEHEGRRRQETGLLEEKEHLLRGSIDAVELTVRKAYQTLLERRQDVEILKETVTISRERLRVQERLKELGNISDNELETFRNRYFQDQDVFFTQQIGLVEAQEELRRAARWFEPALPEGK